MFLSNTYLWLVRLAVSWGNFVPVHESPLFQRIIRLSKCLYVPLDGADLAYAELWATPAERVIRYSEGTDKADPAGFLAQFFSCIRHRVLQIETAKPSGFAGGRKLWGCFFSIFSQSKTSLPQYFTWTRKPKKSLFQTHQYTVFPKWNMLPRCCSFSEKLMILSVLPLVAAACVSGFVAGREPALLWLSQSQLAIRDQSSWAAGLAHSCGLWCPRTTSFGATCRRDLAQGWASSWWDHLKTLPPKAPKVPSHGHDLEIKALLSLSDVLDATTQSWGLKKHHLLNPDTANLMSHSQIWNCTLGGCSPPKVGGFPQFWGHGLSTASGCRCLQWVVDANIFLTKYEGLHQM